MTTNQQCPVILKPVGEQASPPSTHSPAKRLGTLSMTALAIRSGFGFEDGLYTRLAGHDVTRFRVGLRRYVGVTRPEYVEHILYKHPDRYNKSADYDTMNGALGVGIFTDDGPSWKRHRKMINPFFTRKHLNGVFDLILKPVEAAAAGLPKEPTEIEMHDVMVDLTLEVVGNALFFETFDGYFGENTGQLIANALERAMWLARVLLVVEPPAWVNKAVWKMIHAGVPMPPPLSDVQRAVKVIVKDSVDAIIENRRANPTDTPDLLNHLLTVRDEEGPITPERLRAEGATLMLAGHETTANSLSWLWYLLAQNPDARDRLLDEVDAVLGDRAPTVEDLAKLPWTTACFEEAMRLYPPVWLQPRTAIVDDVIDGHYIKAGTTVIMPCYLIQRDPRWWPNPEKFDPSRFMEGSAPRRNSGAYFPFGGGPRICVGWNLAMMESVLITALFSRTHIFDLAPGHEVKPSATFTLHPNGLHMIARPRR
jgi:cytochrome P450